MGGYSLDKLKFLIADDNAHMRKLLAVMLRAFGATDIMEASNGEEAWTMFRNSRTDIVIVDWQLGDISGIEVINRIRNAPDTPNAFVPIVMLTGHSHADHVRIARDSGANEFITKPVSVKGLQAKLTSLIENPRPFVKTPTYFGPCRRRHNLPYPGKERRQTDGASTAQITPPPKDRES